MINSRRDIVPMVIQDRNETNAKRPGSIHHLCRTFVTRNWILAIFPFRGPPEMKMVLSPLMLGSTMENFLCFWSVAVSSGDIFVMNDRGHPLAYFERG